MRSILVGQAAFVGQVLDGLLDRRHEVLAHGINAGPTMGGDA